jgi:hypothetical protein
VGRRNTTLAALLVGASLALAACGGSQTDGAGGSSAPPAAGAPAPGGGLTIDEAIASTAQGPLAVKGYLVVSEDRSARLCDALLESYPPQCGGSSLAVEGLDLAGVYGLTKPNDPSLAQVLWTDSQVSLLGTVDDRTLTVSATSS